MADWKKIRTNIGTAVNKTAQKTGELADTAAKYVKLKSMDMKLSSKYEDLGRLTYKQLKSGTSQAEKISETIEKIDSIRADRKALNDEIEEDKRRRAEKKNAEKAESEKTSEQSGDGENRAENGEEGTEN